MKRRLLLILGGLVACVIVLVLGALLVLQTAWAKDHLRRIALAQSAQSLNGQLSIGRLGGSLFYGVVLDQVSITQAGVTVLDAERIEVRYDPLMLVRQGLVFSELVIHHPRIQATQDSSGWNIANLLKPPAKPASAPLRFSIAHLAVIGATVKIHPSQGQPRTLNNVFVDAQLSRAADGVVAATIERLTGHDERSGTDLTKFSGTFGSSFADIDVSFDLSNRLSRAGGHVRAQSGPAGREITSTMDLSALDLSVIMDDAAWTSDITGHVELHGQLPSSPASTALTFTFAGPRAAAWGYEGADLDVSGSLAGGLLKFAGKGRAYQAEFTVDASWRFASTAGNAPPRFAGRGTFAHVQLTRLPAQISLPRFDTSLAGRYSVEFDPHGWVAEATLQRSRLEGALLGAGTTGRVESRNGRLRYGANGVIAELNVNRLSAPLELPILSERRFRSLINGPFSVQGNGTTAVDRRLTAEATLQDSTLGDTGLPHLALSVELIGPRLVIGAVGNFERLTTETAGVATTALAMDLTGTSDIRVEFPDLRAPFSTETVAVSGRIALGPSTIQGLALKSGTIDATLVEGMATIRELSADLSGVHLTADGCIALGSNGDSALNLSASVDDLQPVGAAVGRPLTGAADLTMAVSGPAGHPRAQGTVNGRGLTYGTTASALTLAAMFDVDLPQRDITLIAGKATVEGTFVKAAGLEIVRLGGSGVYKERRLTLDTRLEQAARTFELGGVIGFEPERRDVTLQRFQMSTGAVVWSLPADTQAHIGLETDRLVVTNLVFVRDTQRIEIDGDLPLGAGPIASETPLGVRMKQVRLSDINEMLMGRRTLDGLVNGSVTISGSMSDPTVAGDVAIVNGMVQGVPFDAARATVRYSGAVATIDAVLDQTPANHFSIKGTVPLSAPGLDVRVTSTPVDLAFIQGFTTEVTGVTGTGVFDVHVTGAVSAPVVDGTVDLDHGTFAVGTTGVAYHDLSARLRFERNHLQVASFSVADEDGHALRATGGLEVIGDDARSIDLRISANGFHVIANQFGTLHIDADLRAEGDLLAPKLTGNLRIEHGRIEVDRVLETTTKSVYSTRPQVAEDAAPDDGLSSTPDPKPAAEVPSEGLASRVDLAITLELPDDLVLRGRDLRAGGSSIGLGDMNIIAGGTLNLEKRRGSSATVVGNLEVVRGFYSFQGRRFDVERGSSVRFRGLVPMDPALDVTAVREVSGIEAAVHIKGSLREPVVSLTSQPSLDEADVLSLIVFGQPVNELGGLQRTSLTERFTSMAAGTIATPLADSVARALNLDLFEIQAPSGDSSAPVVSLGSQIGSRLYVGLKQEVGGTDAGSVAIEYRLADFLRLVTSLATGALEQRGDRRNEGTGVDLIFQMRY